MIILTTDPSGVSDCSIPKLFAVRLSKIGSVIFMFWVPYFKGERLPNFLSILKLHSLFNLWESLVAIGRGTSEITRRKKERNISSKT